MSIKDTIASLTPHNFSLINKWLGYKNEPMPDEVKIVFSSIHELTQKSMMAFAQEANGHMVKGKESGTRHGRRLYERKFAKVKKKFQDELQRLHQIESIMKENKIDIPKQVELGEESK